MVLLVESLPKAFCLRPSLPFFNSTKTTSSFSFALAAKAFFDSAFADLATAGAFDVEVLAFLASLEAGLGSVFEIKMIEFG